MSVCLLQAYIAFLFQLNGASASDTEATFLDLHWFFLMILFLQRLMTNVTVMILGFSLSCFGVFLALPPVGSVSLSSFVSLEHPAMLLTSTLAMS